MAEPLPQLTLALFNPPRRDFAGYHAGGNAEPVAALERWCAGRGPAVVFLWGAPGSGKSHLLEAAVNEAGARQGCRAMYLPLAEFADAGAAVLEGLDEVGVLALDDIDAVAGRPDFERALFALYNALAARGGRLLWAAGRNRGERLFSLDDLDSRLAASLSYQVRAPDDAHKAAALTLAAERRGLRLAPPVAEFILRRQSRDMHDLVAILDLLDRASLRDGRALTIPFVRSVLEAEGGAAPGPGGPGD
ncbi:MAG: DnaA regulatory inactivator Hda [Gammaproteobacteria bacterium]